jgi:long-chain fatty acid transport protein
MAKCKSKLIGEPSLPRACLDLGNPGRRSLTLLAAGGLVSGAVLLDPVTAQAANGLNLIGFGAESVALGGADVALGRDTAALNVNPAGLAGVRQRADAYAAVANSIDVAHEDQFGNNQRVTNRWSYLGGGGYAQRVADTRLHAGIGVFAQAGVGGVYKDLQTAFGTRDELSSLFVVGRVVPGMAWRATDNLSLGVAVAINRIEGKSRVFPDTSSAGPGGAFFGYEYRGLADVQTTPKLGLQIQVTPDLRLGLAYSPQTDFRLEGNRMTVNFGAVGAGKVGYRDVKLEGLALPRQVDAGAAWQLTPKTLVTAEIGWLEWSRAMRNLRLHATQPESGAVPPEIVIVAPLNWRNQTVIALGVEHAWTERTTWRVGFNYGRSPVPENTMQPVLAAIHERHLTGGFSQLVNQNVTISGAFEYHLGNRVTYTNPDIPFGSDTVARNRYLGVTLMGSYLWD